MPKGPITPDAVFVNRDICSIHERLPKRVAMVQIAARFSIIHV